MVDELLRYAHARGMFRAGACHMTTDGDLAELHAFAATIGLGRHLFHNHRSMPHYDLTEPMRAAAVAAGAVEVGWRQQARMRRAAK